MSGVIPQPAPMIVEAVWAALGGTAGDWPLAERATAAALSAMDATEDVTRLRSMWQSSPGTRADITRRYPALAWAIEHVLEAAAESPRDPS